MCLVRLLKTCFISARTNFDHATKINPQKIGASVHVILHLWGITMP